MKMYKKYKSDTVKMVMENPYRLVSDIRGIGFRKADELASRLGFDHESQFRIQSGLKYVLSGDHIPSFVLAVSTTLVPSISSTVTST